ncbi:MAG: DNA translocase FtsK 4TM domain-containing protein [Chromatiaceae bacterium]|nr:DNA translocase FtsK 4TM domain-containing protein [Chromatiaceae bacterium]MCP5428932.1 DNA translocase FtsK 4TM domain-containing protein [Chromatiaceae bacterium]
MHASLSKRLKEGGFLLLLAIGAYFLMALFSYSPDDPSWVFESAKQHADNAGGVAGAWAASVLFMLFGKVAYVFPLMIAWGGWLMFRERDDQQHSVYLRIARWIGFVLTVLSATALASLRMGGLDSLPEGPGGITGDLISSSGTAVLNEAGAILLLLTLLLVGITLFAGVSWLAVMDGVGGFLLNAWRQGVALVAGLAEKRQASRMKQERQEVVKKEKQRKRDKPPPLIEKKEPEIRTSVRVEKERQMTLLDPEPNTELPPLGLLDPPQKSGKGLSTEALQALSGQVERKLADFGVSAEVTAVHPGPVVTLFELQLAPGTKASKVTNLSKDLARALSVVSVRVVEVIPGKTVIGLEIPNEYREMVHLSETLRSEPYDRSKSPLTLALGKDIVGEPVVADLAKMPHALIAGTTGSGKSVAVNAMILSLVYKATAEDIRLIMIDPKMLELSVYEGIPHLLTPVVTDMKEAANALRWCVAEMERRYRLMAALGVRNIAGFNKKVKDAAKAGEPIKDPLFKREPDPITGDLPEIPDLKTIPYIVVVIDEFADMMMVVGKKVEELIARLAQKARAAGVHLLLATQRPSVDVITGLIKANIPTRIAFQVSSRVDSRTILDQMGAESLLGHGDMLYLPAGTSIPQRIHGAFVDDHEVHRVVSHLKQNGKPNYVDEILQEPTEAIPGLSAEASGVELEDQDPLFDEAVNIVTESRRASVSGVQRRLKIGYNRAARLVEEMERIGIVTSADERGNREVLAPPPVKD